MPKAAKASSGPKAAGTARHNPLAASSGNSTRRPATKAKGTAIKTEQTPVPDSSSSFDYLILVCLEGEPTVQRLLSIPANFTFDKVHEVLQIAFGWGYCHAHTFRVTLIDDNPRRFYGDVKMYISPEEMMGFDIGNERTNEKEESEITLQEVYENPEYADKARVTYEYDMGDGWEHEFCFLGRADSRMNKQLNAPETLSVFCVSGQGHPVAEDCGGSMAWEDLKELFTKKGKRDPEGLREWYKSSCVNGDSKGLDPWKWDILDVNEQLAKQFCPRVLEE